MSEVMVVARASAKPGNEEAMERALRANAELSRKEAGCVSYIVLRGDGGVFMAVERWRSSEDFQQHMATPHVQQLLGTLAPLVTAPPDLQVLREV